ncbi:MAG: AGE family epimerase/isomerase [Spirochaetaceae bacterium]|nr:AGE family epimerase/isomerase [Spirochaetaceae bacterium]
METFIDQLLSELKQNILPFWLRYGRDTGSKGFYAYLDNDLCGNRLVPRSVVMTARHLWTYSAAAIALSDRQWLSGAAYAYEYLDSYSDWVFGGMYWTIGVDGSPSDTRKQIYGQAFAIYGMSEYARALFFFGDTAQAQAVSDKAVTLFNYLQTYAYDDEYGGYYEALGSSWQPIANTRLSDVDMNCDKSMNTNLHVLEALTALLRVVRLLRPEAEKAVQDALESLITVTTERICGKDFHLDLFFTREWTAMNDIVSFGHDIEASWLLWEAACEVDKQELKEKVRPIVLNMACVSLKEGFVGTDEYGALENEISEGKRDRTRIWWCQAEALVGFFNAWQLTGEERYRNAVYQEWRWIQQYQKDHKGGDWFWAVSSEGIPDRTQAKGGNWKTPYHNARSCMELLRRIEESSVCSTL